MGQLETQVSSASDAAITIVRSIGWSCKTLLELPFDPQYWWRSEEDTDNVISYDFAARDTFKYLERQLDCLYLLLAPPVLQIIESANQSTVRDFGAVDSAVSPLIRPWFCEKVNSWHEKCLKIAYAFCRIPCVAATEIGRPDWTFGETPKENNPEESISVPFGVVLRPLRFGELPEYYDQLRQEVKRYPVSSLEIIAHGVKEESNRAVASIKLKAGGKTKKGPGRPPLKGVERSLALAIKEAHAQGVSFDDCVTRFRNRLTAILRKKRQTNPRHSFDDAELKEDVRRLHDDARHWK